MSSAEPGIAFPPLAHQLRIALKATGWTPSQAARVLVHELCLRAPQSERRARESLRTTAALRAAEALTDMLDGVPPKSPLISPQTGRQIAAFVIAVASLSRPGRMASVNAALFAPLGSTNASSAPLATPSSDAK